MKRILELSTLAGAIAAAVLLPSPLSRSEAHANQLGRVLNDVGYYSGGYAPVYNGYSGYGYSPYGNGGYTYYAPRAYVYPARHFASPHTDPALPRMGERLRLRASFDTSGFPPHAKVILEALKRYGMFVADNGIEWAISVAPDPRIPVMNDEFRKVKGSDFEVVTPPPGYKPPAD